MKFDIKKQLDGDCLCVDVSLSLRRFLTEKKEFLNTDFLIKALELEGYKIKEIKSEPQRPLANTKSAGYKQLGSWVFLLEPQKKPVPAKKTSTRKKKATTSRKPASIKTRMSNVAQKKKEME